MIDTESTSTEYSAQNPDQEIERAHEEHPNLTVYRYLSGMVDVKDRLEDFAGLYAMVYYYPPMMAGKKI